MSVPTAELTAPVAGSRSGNRPSATTPRLPGARLYLALGAGALVLGALSLLIPSTPSYDPWSWLVWGREIVHLDLQTTDGPTWKPLTVIFTTLFAPFGKAAPDMWLVVARAGGLVAVAMTFKLCFRLIRALERPAEGEGEPTGSPIAAYGPAVLGAAITAVGLGLTNGFASNSALGYSEGIMTALVLISVERHIDGSPRQAFAVGFFAALGRPELWLFWGTYGAWLYWRDPGARKLVIGLFTLIPILWFAPEYWGSGHFFRGVSRAHSPRSNSAAFASCPFCSELVKHAWPTVLLRIKLAAALGVGVGGWILVRGLRSRGASWRTWRPVPGAEHALAATVGAGLLGLSWWFLISVLTQVGFSGNDRYLVLGAALIEIAGGVAFGWLAIAVAGQCSRRIGILRGRAGAGSAAAVALLALVFVFVPNQVGGNLIDIQRTHRSLVYQAHLRSSAASAVSRLGGRQRIFACGAVMTEGFQVPLLAWTLGVPISGVEAAPVVAGSPGPPPAVIFQTRANQSRRTRRLPMLRSWPTVGYRLVLRNRTFRVYEHCGK